MLIFGAGASYDSAPTRQVSDFPREEYRPPLANQLFEARSSFNSAMRRFPDCLPVIPRLQHGNVERALEHLLMEANDYPQRHRQLAAIKFYLQMTLWECESKWKEEALRGISNYTALLDYVERWRDRSNGLEEVLGGYREVCLVTFNYDTLLESGLRSALGRDILSMAHYIEDGPYKVIKVHGSTNWVRDIENRLESESGKHLWKVVEETIARAPELVITDKYRLLNPTNHPFGDFQARGVGFPAIAIPVETKRAFECPQDHLDALRECISRVTKLLIIGWRGRDQHFVDLLKAAPRGGRCVVIAGGEMGAREIMDHLQNSLEFDFSLTKAGFSEFIANPDAVRVALGK